jgi:hypothetical protein
VSPAWRFYEDIAVDLPAGVDIPFRVAEAAVSVDARRWAARKAQDDLRDAREALEAAEQHDAAAEAEAAFRGEDPPRPTRTKRAEAVGTAARVAEAYAVAAKTAVRVFLDELWQARCDGWQGQLAELREQARCGLIDDLRQVFCAFEHLAVLDHALGALDQLAEGGGHCGGWTLAATPEAADRHRAHAEELLAAALEPRQNQLGWRTPAPVEDILCDLARHLLSPDIEPEQIAHAATNPAGDRRSQRSRHAPPASADRGSASFQRTRQQRGDRALPRPAQPATRTRRTPRHLAAIRHHALQGRFPRL